MLRQIINKIINFVLKFDVGSHHIPRCFSKCLCVKPDCKFLFVFSSHTYSRPLSVWFAKFNNNHAVTCDSCDAVWLSI